MQRITALCVLAVLFVSTMAMAQETAPVKPALLVIDIQNRYIPMMDQSDVEMPMQYINGAIYYFRQYDLPVIRVYNTNEEWGPQPGTDDFEFPESVNILESDPKIVKTTPSAFVKTELDELLKEKEINTVFLCGLSATGCVLATYFGAMERDYDAFMIEGSVMSDDVGQTKAIQEIVQSVSWPAFKLVLKAAAE